MLSSCSRGGRGHNAAKLLISSSSLYSLFIFFKFFSIPFFLRTFCCCCRLDRCRCVLYLIFVSASIGLSQPRAWLIIFKAPGKASPSSHRTQIASLGSSHLPLRRISCAEETTGPRAYAQSVFVLSVHPDLSITSPVTGMVRTIVSLCKWNRHAASSVLHSKSCFSNNVTVATDVTVLLLNLE